jgi:hypothetical protein
VLKGGGDIQIKSKGDIGDRGGGGGGMGCSREVVISKSNLKVTSGIEVEVVVLVL